MKIRIMNAMTSKMRKIKSRKMATRRNALLLLI